MFFNSFIEELQTKKPSKPTKRSNRLAFFSLSIHLPFSLLAVHNRVIKILVQAPVQLLLSRKSAGLKCRMKCFLQLFYCMCLSKICQLVWLNRKAYVVKWKCKNSINGAWNRRTRKMHTEIDKLLFFSFIFRQVRAYGQHAVSLSCIYVNCVKCPNIWFPDT